MVNDIKVLIIEDSKAFLNYEVAQLGPAIKRELDYLNRKIKWEKLDLYRYRVLFKKTFYFYYRHSTNIK